MDRDSAALDRATVDMLLTTTRSVRLRLDLTREVPREVIVECLRVAIHAPTGSNRQAWRWLVVTDPAVRARLGELYQRGQGARPAGAPQVDDRISRSVAHLRDHIAEVPVLVIPCIEESPAGPAGWPPSIYPAVWNLQLALRSRGLGSCITTSHLRCRDEAADLLGIPDGYVQACLLPVAYFLGETFKPPARRPIEEITFWDHWGTTS